ncbi:MAG: hypothetical protein MUF73_07595 [Rhodobacteraceae bacterium]|nr:hypothetical protein [Paracoccaceae bacterium]
MEVVRSVGAGFHAPVAHADIIARLDRLIRYPGIAPAIAARAERMRVALQRPVRVTVLGLPGSGKSDVVNLLAGRRVLSGVPDLPTAEITDRISGDTTAGSVPVTEVTLADGRQLALPGLPNAATAALAPVFLRVVVPGAPGLARFQPLEVVSDGSPGDMAAAVRWAMPRTDIALWCTARLTDADRAAWDAAPDAVKDHAVLVLTGAQGPVPAGRPIRSGLPDGFRAAWPIWRARLRQALDDGDADGLTASGAAALTAALTGIAEAARSADAEVAQVFLSRVEPPALRSASPQDAPASVSDAPAAAPAHGAAPPRVGSWVPEQAIAAQRLLRDRTAALHGAAASALDSGPQEVAAVAGDVLATCAGIAEELAQVLTTDDLDDAAEALRPLRDAVDEVVDLVVLMGIEGGPDRAADAAALLAQLRGTFDRFLADAQAGGALAA